MKAVVHAGFHKAGTKTLQNFLAVHRKWLAEQGVHYPIGADDRHAGHHLLACWLSSSRDSDGDNDLFVPEREIFSRTHAARIIPAARFTETLTSDHPVCLISSEVIDTFNAQELANLKSYLDPIDRVIVYVRNGISFIQSCWAAKIRWGYTGSFETFLRETVAFQPGTPVIGPLRFAETVVDLLGLEKLCVRSFDAALKQPSGLIGDFLVGALGLPAPEGLEMCQILNASPSPVVAEVLRALNIRAGSLAGKGAPASHARLHAALSAPEGWRLLDEFTRRLAPITKTIAIAELRPANIRPDGSIDRAMHSGGCPCARGFMARGDHRISNGEQVNMISGLAMKLWPDQNTGNWSFEWIPILGGFVYDFQMAEIDLRALSQNDVVLHFGVRPNEVDAFTFSTSLVALSEALLELNRQISPSLSIEITIEGIGPGSFRAKIGTKVKSLASFFASDARELLISLLATFIYTRVLDSQSPPQIIVNEDSVIVVSGSDRIIIPRKTWDAKEHLPKQKAVEKHVAKAFEIIDDDQSVSDFGFVARISDAHPIGVIQKSQFAILTRIPEEEAEDDGRRICDERTPVTVLKVIFERSSRRWQFVWRRVRISAPIEDEEFFTKLASREYVFSQGDVLDVTLRIYQIRDEISGAFINDRY